MPRPCLLEDPQRAELLIGAVEDALRKKASYAQAAIAAGLHPATHYEWLQKGEADRAAGKDTVWSEYSERAARARAQAEADAVKIVSDAADGWVEEREELIEAPDGTTRKRSRTTRRDWRAAAWWLERAMPERWGAQSTVHVSGVEAKTWNIPGLVLPGAGEAKAQLPVSTEPESVPIEESKEG